MGERRKLERKQLVNYLRIFDRNTDQLIGHLADITTEGIRIISEDPQEVNATFQLKMLLPAKIEEVEQITFDAKCVWCNPGTMPDTHESGFKLLEISAKDLGVAQRLVKDYGYLELVSLFADKGDA